MRLPTSLFILVAMVAACSDYDLKSIQRGGGAGTQTLDTAVSVPVPEEDEPEEDEPEEELVDYEVTLRLSADDQWEGWIDGERIDQQEGWNQVSEYSYVLGSGAHVVAVRVDDLHLIINGFIAEVSVDGEIWGLTGGGMWRVRDTEPPVEWTEPAYVDGDWGLPVVCLDDAPWSGIPTLVNPEAEWVWYDLDCRRELGTGWFRLVLELP